MSLEYSFLVPEKPRPKSRPRFSKGRVYTAPETVEYQEKVAAAYRGPNFGTDPIGIDIQLSDLGAIVIVRSTMRSDSKLRGDLDNYAKAILDALEGIAFDNDRQLVELRVSKG